MGRWQLGNPSLILDLPGDPRSGGVDWHPSNSFAVLPTSWSAENDDLKVEVSTTFASTEAQAVLNAVAPKIGGTARTKPLTISGYPAVRGDVSGKPVLAIQAEGRAWIIVATPKTNNGTSLATRVLDGVYVERSGEKRWVQRSLGNTRMNAELPFDLAAKQTTVNEGKAYELHFDDFRVEASISYPGEGKVIDFGKTISTYIEGEKKIPGTDDFKSKRERVKRDQLDGEIVRIELKRGSRQYKIVSFFAQVDQSLLRMDISGRADSAAHDSNIDRILSSLKVSSVNFANFSPRQVGNEGVWFDVPKEFSETSSNSSSKMYTCFPGAFQLDVRFTDADPATGYNADQLLDFIEVKFKSVKDSRDFKTERFSKYVNGLETRILKTQYKTKGRGDFTIQYAIAIFAPGRIIVGEMICEEQQKGYLERIVDSVRIELKAPPGWTRQQIGDSGLSMLAEKLEIRRPTPSADLESLNEIDMNGEGLIVTITESRFKQSPKSPSKFVTEVFNIIKTSAGATGKITTQQPWEIGNYSGLRAGMELELPQGKLVGDIVVLRKDKQIVVLVVAADSKNSSALVKRYTIINSIR